MRRALTWRLLCGVVLLAGCAPPPARAREPAPAGGGSPVAAPPAPAHGRDHPFGVSPPDTGPHEFIKAAAPRAEQLYATFCATCHGAEGRGDGRAAPFTRVPPTDFTRAEFKLRSTPMGSLPTDADLEAVIRSGAGGDGVMPAFPHLAAADVRALVQKIKSFSPRWMVDRPPNAVPLPAFFAGDAQRGEEIYRKWGCADCHGANGAGDGVMSRSLRDARGVPEAPADLTRPWTFKRGGAESQLLRSIVTGFAGTSMASYAPPLRSGPDLRDLVAHLRSRQRPAPAPVRAAIDASTIASYWRAPLHAGTAAIASSTCAACHPQQFADWSRSRHALAMSPGVWAQLQDRESGGDCVRCHAPLAEQARDAFLLADGVSCAACHLRGGQLFGPAPTPSTLLPLVSGATPPHGRIRTRPFFEQAEFCNGCHHFPAGTAPMVAGTTLQNTYEEWRSSRAAREGRTCQTCHMPNRRHLFRGIHDPDTVRRAVRWNFETGPQAGAVEARMTLTNAGAGHYLPTYVVPEIWMQIDVRDGAGAILARVEHRIARRVTSERGEWTQTSDTRLAPDATATLELSGPLPRAAAVIVGRVLVLPDVWQADKFRARLAEGPAGSARDYYAAALEEAEASGYTLFQAERRVEDIR